MQERSLTTYQRQLTIKPAPMHRCDSKLASLLVTSYKDKVIMAGTQRCNAWRLICAQAEGERAEARRREDQTIRVRLAMGIEIRGGVRKRRETEALESATLQCCLSAKSNEGCSRL